MCVSGGVTEWLNLDGDTMSGGVPLKPKAPAKTPTKKPTTPGAPPTKTAKPVSDAAEAERLRAAFGAKGWPGLLLTSGLGDLSQVKLGGVTLGA